MILPIFVIDLAFNVVRVSRRIAHCWRSVMCYSINCCLHIGDFFYHDAILAYFYSNVFRGQVAMPVPPTPHPLETSEKIFDEIHC